MVGRDGGHGADQHVGRTGEHRLLREVAELANPRRAQVEIHHVLSVEREIIERVVAVVGAATESPVELVGAGHRGLTVRERHSAAGGLDGRPGVDGRFERHVGVRANDRPRLSGRADGRQVYLQVNGVVDGLRRENRIAARVGAASDDEAVPRARGAHIVRGADQVAEPVRVVGRPVGAIVDGVVPPTVALDVEVVARAIDSPEQGSQPAVVLEDEVAEIDARLACDSHRLLDPQSSLAAARDINVVPGRVAEEIVADGADPVVVAHVGTDAAIAEDA